MMARQVSSPIKWGAVHPSGGEPERVHLGLEHGAGFPHAGKVHRAAVDVHDPFEKGERFFVVGIHISDDLLFDI